MREKLRKTERKGESERGREREREMQVITSFLLAR